MLFFPLVLAQNETEPFNFTLTVNNKTITINYTEGFVHIHGEVINITFLPEFDIDLRPLLFCHFTPFTTPHLGTTKYQLVCDYGHNVTPEMIYAPIPVDMLKAFEQIKIDEKEFAETKGQLLIYRVWAIAATVAFFAYVLYEKWWTLRD